MRLPHPLEPARPRFRARRRPAHPLLSAAFGLVRRGSACGRGGIVRVPFDEPSRAIASAFGASRRRGAAGPFRRCPTIFPRSTAVLAAHRQDREAESARLRSLPIQPGQAAPTGSGAPVRIRSRRLFPEIVALFEENGFIWRQVSISIRALRVPPRACGSRREVAEEAAARGKVMWKERSFACRSGML